MSEEITRDEARELNTDDYLKHAGGPAMTGDAPHPTPGQAAREAFGELGADWYPGTPWNELHQDLRAQWEAAAAAVMLMAQATVDYAELTSLREQHAKARPLTAPDGVAGLLADVAERDDRPAEVRTRLTAARDIARTATRERQQAAAGLQEVHDALAAAWPGKDLAEGAEALLTAGLVRERDEARSAFARLVGHFAQGRQSGWSARVSGSVLRRLCVMAMCEPPSGSGQPDDADPLAELADHPLVAHAIAVARASARALEARDG